MILLKADEGFSNPQITAAIKVSRPCVEDYAYYPWTNQGVRLESLTSGPNTDPDGLQSLTYSYDDVGNVQSIDDAVNGSPQTQAFTYDDIYRLETAQASGGGQGNYAQQSYSYDPNSGNLASKAGGELHLRGRQPRPRCDDAFKREHLCL